MENHVRIFREKPFGYFDKPIMRYLRKKYGKDKKRFIALRSTYLAICEMESDFESNAISAFNKTVGTYAGLSREAVGKYVKMLEKEGLIQKVRISDPTTHLQSKGTYLRILSSLEFAKTHPDIDEEETLPKSAVSTVRTRMSGYPDIRISRHSDTPTVIKKIRVSKKKKKNVKEKEDRGSEERIEYYANLIAEKLGDRKSLSYYKLACRRHEPTQLLQKANAIMSDGGANKPAAVFVAWLKKERPDASPPKSDHPG
jgi:hypothetical protein